MLRQKKVEQKNVKKTNQFFFYGLISLGVLVLAWIINKDINIPSWLVIFVSIIGSFLLLLYGIKRPEVTFYVLVAYVPFNKRVLHSRRIYDGA